MTKRKKSHDAGKEDSYNLRERKYWMIVPGERVGGGERE
jgi:hypothetical protein